MEAELEHAAHAEHEEGHRGVGSEGRGGSHRASSTLATKDSGVIRQ
jgi:hypothetical protein